VVPDLGKIVQEYLRDQRPLASHDFVRRLLLNHNISDLVHPGSNHSQMFDQNSLLHLFREAGFEGAVAADYLGSAIPEIGNIELDSRKQESLYVEAQR